MSTTKLCRTGPKTERLTILRAATHETELGDHDFCLSQSHYTDIDPTSRKRENIGEDDEGSPVDDVDEEIGEEIGVECDGEEDNETTIDLDSRPRPRSKFQ